MAKIASELEESYKSGQMDAIAGHPIKTKTAFMANNIWNLPHDLMVDKYYAYGSGYRMQVAKKQVRSQANA